MEGYQALLQGEYWDILQSHPFFHGLAKQEITAFMHHAAPEPVIVEPEHPVELQPGTKRKLGMVITGSVKVFAIDYGGNKAIINAVKGQGSVGSMQFMMQHYNMMFEIAAQEPSVVLLFEPQTLLRTEEDIAAVQHKILVNLLMAQREMFFELSDHLVCLSQKNIRGKVLRYLQIQSEKNFAYEFDVSLTREEMAAYLAVDRASLSRTLGELKREGVIAFRKNHFSILSTKYFLY